MINKYVNNQVPSGEYGCFGGASTVWRFVCKLETGEVHFRVSDSDPGQPNKHYYSQERKGTPPPKKKIGLLSIFFLLTRHFALKGVCHDIFDLQFFS